MIPQKLKDKISKMEDKLLEIEDNKSMHYTYVKGLIAGMRAAALIFEDEGKAIESKYIHASPDGEKIKLPREDIIHQFLMERSAAIKSGEEY